MGDKIQYALNFTLLSLVLKKSVSCAYLGQRLECHCLLKPVGGVFFAKVSYILTKTEWESKGGKGSYCIVCKEVDWLYLEAKKIFIF